MSLYADYQFDKPCYVEYFEIGSDIKNGQVIGDFLFVVGQVNELNYLYKYKLPKSDSALRLRISIEATQILKFGNDALLIVDKKGEIRIIDIKTMS